MQRGSKPERYGQLISWTASARLYSDRIPALASSPGHDTIPFSDFCRRGIKVAPESIQKTVEAKPTRLDFCFENKEVIHSIALHKVITIHQLVTRLLCLVDNDLLGYSVVLSIAVAVNDSDSGFRSERFAKVFQQSYRLGDFVVGLKEKNRIDLSSRQQRIIALAEDCLHVAKTVLRDSLLNVGDGFRIDIVGINFTP